MLSAGMLALRHLRRTMRRRGLNPGSAPAICTATLISRLNLPNIFDLFASIGPLKCLTLAHLLCPAILVFQFVSFLKVLRDDSRSLKTTPSALWPHANMDTTLPSFVQIEHQARDHTRANFPCQWGTAPEPKRRPGEPKGG